MVSFRAARTGKMGSGWTKAGEGQAATFHLQFFIYFVNLVEKKKGKRKKKQNRSLSLDPIFGPSFESFMLLI